ncbi:MAG: hypothetical protein U5K81_09080 [Trueperaceae bacterium]|nr:hypothetical protein [Trueperaceae bacterium]
MPASVSRQVAFRSGDHVLRGTLTLPAGPGPHPAVITLSGSGPQNRDGELPGIPGYRPFAQVAEHLAERGVAVLRYDDRGVAASEGDNATATSGDLAAWTPGRPSAPCSAGPTSTRSTSGCWGTAKAGCWPRWWRPAIQASRS